ncbi:MAG: hypothetical protein A2Z25_07510 [Planctomycetes bacterium RBG_16_55_9]|nr:MAG: hypothetical protein A2Z25_07510 [Planctomycetes bacterium RBG_16_55_9]
MDEKRQLVGAVIESAGSTQPSDGRKRLTCAEAFDLAKRFKVDIIEIGRICNQHNIRICKCQLGCFK